MFNIKERYLNLSVGIKAAFWFMLCNFLQRGIAAFTTLIFTRLMPVASFGTITVYNSWKQMLMIFVTLNLFYGMYNTGIIKFKNEENAFTSSLLGLTSLMCLIYFLIFFVFQNYISTVFGLTNTQTLLMIIDILGNAAFSFWAAQERFNYRYKKLFLLTLLLFISSIGFPLLFIPYCQDKANALIFGRILGQSLIAIYIYFCIITKGRKLVSMKYWRFAFVPAIILVPHYISYEVLSVSDRIMISKMVSAEKAAIYSVSYTISLILTILISAINQAFAPWILKKLNDKLYDGIDFLTREITWTFTFMVIIIISLAPEIVSIIVPKEYSEAIWIIAPVCISTLFIFWYNIIANVEFFYLKTKTIAVASFTGASLNILLNYLLIPLCGYVIAGYTTLFCYGIYFAMHYHSVSCICKNTLNIPNIFSLSTFAKPMLICILCGFVALGFYNYPVIRYACVVIGSFVFIFNKYNKLKNTFF